MSASETGTTSVPAPYFTDAGFVAPSESDMLSGALADINAAFGNLLNTALSTPQGQLAMSLTAILGDAYDQMLALFNGVDPDRASGRMQDAVGKLYFMTRRGATATVVTVVCTGAAGTVIPEGMLIQDGNGKTYAADGAITIDATGTGTGTFSCTETGAIECASSSVSVYQSVVGLSSVTNPSAGVTGSDEESRVEFEQRRQESVAANSVGSLDAVLGAVEAVSGVTDAYVTDNSTDAAETTNGVSIAAHSLFVCVNGGADEDIARAILSKKPPGCGYTGTSSVTVTDSNSGYTTAPSYTVQFTRATPTPVYIAVTLKSSSSVPSTATSDVQAAIISAFNGGDGGARARIASLLFASRYYAPIVALGSWVQIVEITIGTAANPSGFTLQMQADQIPTIEAANITVAIA
ncbi:baseplate J/gp47 family protein [Acetobacter pomorum]|uniref:baseplate J/gp47 family protein n=1 Tax=Acetobacter pomorum TaxID=65959 RepID=UPI001EE8EC27|nr:baseplate J/gp47 family protein [Acetobacter pomorum]